jgi:predicted transposase/invertase (TIGR01784 family)
MKNKKKISKPLEPPVFMNLKTDFGFKKIFGNKKILIAFLNTILSEKITDIDYLPPEQLGIKEKNRKAVYDLYCKSDTGKYFIVEMQASPQPNFVDRELYYVSHSIINQAPKGKVTKINEKGEEIKVPWNYSIKGIYVVGILDFILFPEKGAEDIVVEYIDLVRRNSRKLLTDKFELVTVELPKFKKTKEELRTITDKWLYSLKNMENLSEAPEEMDEEIFKELYKEARIDNLNEKEMKDYQRSVLEYDDVILAVDYAEERGIEIGEKRGVKIGERRGVEIGEKQGIEKEQIKFVRNCYKRNMSIEEIAELTDLKTEQISAILTNKFA